MRYIHFLLFLGAICLAASCDKDELDPPEAVLPDEIAFGESEVYLNGELKDGYQPAFKYIEVYKTMNYGFLERPQELLINSVGFSWLPLETGNFELHTERIPFIKAKTSFNQTIQEDLEGYSYELIDADEGFFNVEALDTVKHEVKGRFKAKFKRTSKNGNGDLGLPKVLLFQGVFYENYEVH